MRRGARAVAVLAVTGAVLLPGRALGSDVVIEFLEGPAASSDLSGLVHVTVRASTALSFLKSFSVAVQSEDPAVPSGAPQVAHGPWGVLEAVREDTITLTWDTSGALGGTYRVVAVARSHLDADEAPVVSTIQGLRVNVGSPAGPSAADAARQQRQQAPPPRSVVGLGRVDPATAPLPEEGPDPVAADPEPAAPEGSVQGSQGALSPPPAGARPAAALLAWVFLLWTAVAARRRALREPTWEAAPAPLPKSDPGWRRARRRGRAPSAYVPRRTF